MALDIRSLLDDFDIEWADSGKEVTRGWINMQCCFCGDTKTHLGYMPELDMFSCWKCGQHSVTKTLMTLLNLPYSEINQIIKSYKDHNVTQIIREATDWKKKLVLPKNYGTLKRRHKVYLEGRGFDADRAMNQFGLVGTTNRGEYANRIIFPIYYKGKLVSYHSRDITDDHEMKALACNHEDEVIRHKELLYNFDNITNVAVLTEAPLDAIKIGYDIGIATMGIKFTTQQIELLRTIPYLFVAFDSGPGEHIAQKQAKRIADLCGIYRPVYVIDDLEKDPAELTDNEVKKIRKEIFKIVNKDTC